MQGRGEFRGNQVGGDLPEFCKKGRQPNQVGGGKNKTAPRNEHDVSDPDYKFGGSYFNDFTDISGGVGGLNKSGSFADSNNVIKNKLGDKNKANFDNISQDKQSNSSKKSINSLRNKNKIVPFSDPYADEPTGGDAGANNIENSKESSIHNSSQGRPKFEDFHQP